MNKQDVYDLLDKKGFEYEKAEHIPVFTVEEILHIGLPHDEWGAKNLFLRDDKKRNYYLLTAADARQIDIKAFQFAQGTRRLSFASPDDLWAILKLTPGSVTPLGLLNDEGATVHFYLDEYFRGGHIGIHPLSNDATVWMKTDDLLSLITEHGNDVHWF